MSCLSWLPEQQMSLVVKRSFDLVIGLLILILFMPVLFCIALLIRLDSPGPAFFVQKRLGKNGKVFNCFKFRTMVDGAEQGLSALFKKKPAFKGEWEANFKIRNDPRVTRVGRFLRKTSLDELPQIINVILGQMSLVGPRPRPLYELDGRRDNYEFQVGLRVRPGITGLWQVSGRNKLNFEQRVTMDAIYVRKWSLCTDFQLLLKTVGIVIKQRGAY